MKKTGKQPRPPHAPLPPNVPGYAALRVAADWASAVRNEPLYLSYDPASGHVTAADKANAELTLQTSTYARRPRVVTVEFVVQVQEGKKTETRTLTLPGEAASALFWGEGAVEKFLVPYYASSAADNAAPFLARLLNAWYGYPGGVVQVCALAYLCGTRAPAVGTALTLGATVGVVCLERARRELRLLTLDEFTKRYAPGMPRSTPQAERPGTPRRMAGWRVTTEMESVVARDVAEFVSGLRGHFVTFQTEGDTLYPELYPTDQPLPAPDPAPAGVFRLAALAEPVRGDRPYPESVTVRVRDLRGQEHTHPVVGVDGDPATSPDCMFWSDGALEKLMLPYYASVKGGSAPYYIEVLMGRWDGVIPPGDPEPDVGASMRARLSGLFGAAAAGTSAAPDDDHESSVYTVTHLPRSEYAATPPPEGLESRTVLLVEEGGATALYGANGLPAGTAQRGAGGAAKRSRKRTSRAT